MLNNRDVDGVMKTMKSKRNWSICALAGLLLAGGPAPAKHPSNAGPENVELKFKLPPPKVLSVEEAVKAFTLAEDDLEITAVAAEPLVGDPIAVSWDERGRMFVVEFRGYMHDVEGRGEKEPIGVIALLEDTDDDGRYDKRSTFMEGLVMPRAVMAVNGGALVAEPPNLIFAKDTDGDGRADEKTVVLSNYGSKGGQPEHMANSPVWALDNWIYNGKHPARLRLKRGGTFVAESTTARGQWGLTQDDVGRLYYNYNSDLLRVDLVPPAYTTRNPNYQPATAVNVKAMKDQTVWPGHPTPGVNRGYNPGALRDDGSLKSATATCGPGVYRGDLLPPRFRGNVFIPEPSANLLKRVTLIEQGGVVEAKNAYEGKEFLTSTDERFRPVNAYTGPDGALYVVDLYRGILQHKGFLTHYLIKNIQDRKLDQPIGHGRIWRIAPKGSKPKFVKIPGTAAETAPLLAHPNGWVRDTAQRVLIERNEKGTDAQVRKLLRTTDNPLGRLHALWTLDGLGKLEIETVVKSLSDDDARVRAAAVRLSEPFLVPLTRPEVMPDLLKLESDPAADVQLQLALTLSGIADPDAEAALARALEKGADNALIRDAAVSGLRGRELEFIERLLKQPAWSSKTAGREDLLTALGQCVLLERRSARVKRLFAIIGAEPQPWRQAAILEGMAGQPAKKGGPPPKLIYLDERPETLAALLESKDKPIREYAARVDARIAWPGKPGVPPPPVVKPLTPAEQSLFEKGKVVYANTCAACHQPNGLGQDGLAPPLMDSEWVLGPGAEAKMIRIVTQGLMGPITVQGRSHNLEMPGLPTLTDEEVAAVLTYVRREWEHGASPVGVETVKKVRSESVGREGMWTGPELQKLK